jgi:hypothetical protein
VTTNFFHRRWKEIRAKALKSLLQKRSEKRMELELIRAKGLKNSRGEACLRCEMRLRAE